MTQDINALLGKGSEFEGKLTFEGTVRIDGRFTGEIFSDGTLIVGEGAEVNAEVRVATVMVYGEVNGNIFATDSVELHAPATLRGNIASPSLNVDKGVFFDGACQMINDTEPTGRTHVTTPPALPARSAANSGDVVAPSAQQTARKISGMYQADSARTPELKHSF